MLAHTPKAEIERRVTEVLAFVELSDKRDAYVSQLSGGQKQRVAIARALATSPDILLCDEATSALDPQTTESILRLLKRVNQEMGVTILLITHQMQVIQMICNKVAVMEQGRVVEQGEVLEVFGRPRHPTTRHFVRTVINDRIPDNFHEVIRTSEWSCSSSSATRCMSPSLPGSAAPRGWRSTSWARTFRNCKTAS